MTFDGCCGSVKTIVVVEQRFLTTRSSCHELNALNVQQDCWIILVLQNVFGLLAATAA